MTFTLAAQEVEADLYRPAASALVLQYAPAQLDERTPLKPVLHLYGHGFRAGKGVLDYTLRAGKKALHQGRLDLDSPGQVFECGLTLDEPFPTADRVDWSVRSGNEVTKGSAPLRWSRFRGRVEYVDGRQRPSYISMHPYTFKDAEFMVPVGEDGRFDLQIPARTYAVVNVNGAGYAVDAMERWAWAFDLTQDREEVFRVGRTELYSMHAFGILGGLSTILVTFRPTALTRYLQHVVPAQGQPKDAATMALVAEHLKHNPMGLAPELTKERTKVWLDGVAQPISDLARIVETNNQGIPQTQYILQINPPKRPDRGVRHEIKVEVESLDVLNGKLITDFGQGSVGLYLE